jgi:hypothetical protein
VGSNSNIGDNGMAAEEGRAAIWVYDIAARQARIYASGLRNPNGLDFEPNTGAIWTVVNERDEIGLDVPPDNLTSVTDGGFYGFPYSCWGPNVDQRVNPPDPDLVSEATTSDSGLGPHTASLGLTFYRAGAFPPPYCGGAFVGQHGSWNRQPLHGYRVVFIPFANGRPRMPAQTFLHLLPQRRGQDPGSASRWTPEARYWWPTTWAASCGASRRRQVPGSVHKRERRKLLWRVPTAMESLPLNRKSPVHMTPEPRATDHRTATCPTKPLSTPGLLPLDRPRRLRLDVVGLPADSAHLVGDAIGDAAQKGMVERVVV